MHDEVDLAPLLLDCGEHRVDGSRIGDVAVAEQGGAEFGGERLDALLQRLALPGQTDLGSSVAAGPRDAIGDRSVIGETEDDAPLALHQPGIVNHCTQTPDRFAKWAPP
jgi:hypothetical protein